MAFRLIKARRKHIRKQKSENGEEILHRIEEYLSQDIIIPAQILYSFWQDQQNAITYKEIRELIKDDLVTAQTLEQWRQDYSHLVSNSLKNMWTDAVEAGAHGQPLMDAVFNDGFRFEVNNPWVMDWIRNRGAQLVTNSTEAQRSAIAYLTSEKMQEQYTVDELAVRIRPCIGLTEQQVRANTNYYNNIVNTLTRDHPKMSQETIRRRAQEAAQKYAEKQHRYRAMTIAQTESAFAYNRGADEGIRQAQEQGLIGVVRKIWTTSGDAAVCDKCAALDGVEVGMDEVFNTGSRSLFDGQNLLPPAHPRCACAVQYVETGEPYVQTQEYMYNVNELENSLSSFEENDIILTDEERYALNQYMSFESYNLNEKLRYSQALTENEQIMCTNLDSALQKMSKYQGNVTRSVEFGDKKQAEKYVKQYEIDTKISFKEFISTTCSEGLYNPDGEVQIFIRNSRNGRDISMFNQGEKEVLYERNSSFKVIKKEMYEGKYYILLEEC